MDQLYRDAVSRMEAAGVSPDYILGWQSGYLGHPEREQQRVSDAYVAGRKDGEEKKADNFSAWTGKTD